MRRAARTDDNHTEIVDAFCAHGCEVLSLAAVGKGCPDLMVDTRMGILLIEIKNPKQPPSARRLTKDQVDFHQRWPVNVVMNAADVTRLLHGAST